MDGRLLDIHYRLNNDELHFSLPNDMEISLLNLKHIVNQCKLYHDHVGTSYKIVTTKYIIQDTLVPSLDNISIHLAIYKQSLNGQRELYRHFIKKHDGSICEIFDTMQTLGIHEYEILEENYIENLMKMMNYNKMKLIIL